MSRSFVSQKVCWCQWYAVIINTDKPAVGRLFKKEANVNDKAGIIRNRLVIFLPLKQHQPVIVYIESMSSPAGQANYRKFAMLKPVLKRCVVFFIVRIFNGVAGNLIAAVAVK
jgi:hypothetical protein